MIRTRAGIWLAALATLAGCSPPPAPTAQSRGDRSVLNGCRQRADEVYLRQNRAALYAQDDRYSPESGSYNSGITTRGLAERYGWDTQVSDCVRNQGAPPTTAAPTGPEMTPVPR